MKPIIIEILNRLLLLFILVVPNIYLVLILARVKKCLKSLLIPAFCMSLLILIFLNIIIITSQTRTAQDFNKIQNPFFHFKES